MPNRSESEKFISEQEDQQKTRARLEIKCDPAYWHAWLSSWRANGGIPAIEYIQVNGEWATCIRRDPMPMVITDQSRLIAYGNGSGTYLVIKAQSSGLKGMILDEAGNSTGVNIRTANLMESYGVLERLSVIGSDEGMIVDQMLGIMENTRDVVVNIYRQDVGFCLDMTPSEHVTRLLEEISESLLIQEGSI